MSRKKFHKNEMKMEGRKIARRKAHPSPPRWVWYELDGCWCCQHKSGCSNCKILKEYAAIERKKRWEKDKRNLQKSLDTWE